MADYDAIIIGTGQAGPALARRLVAAGWKVAIIERKLFGGTCVNTGCTPTKTLVASAYAAHLARRAADYGVTIGGPVGVDMKAVKARKDAVVRASRKGVERSLKTLKGCTVYEGHARFVGPKEVEVGDEVLRADKIFINVGARALVPPMPGLDQVPYLTNSSMMDVDFLPPHLIVLGGSYVGLEFAQVYRRFGSEVTVIELAPRLIAREDEDVSRAIAEILKEEDIDIRVNSKVVAVAKARQRHRGDGRECRNELAGRRLPSVAGDRPAAEHGRSRPRQGRRRHRSARLHPGGRPVAHQRARHLGDGGLQRPGRLHPHLLERFRDRRGEPSRQRSATRQRSHHRLRALHRSAARPRRHDRGRGPQVRPAGADRDHGHGGREPRVSRKARRKGFMKILVDKETKQILGASLLGLSGDEAIHCILDIMYAKAPYTVLQRAMHIHPTVSEFIPTMLDDLKPLS